MRIAKLLCAGCCVLLSVGAVQAQNGGNRGQVGSITLRALNGCAELEQEISDQEDLNENGSDSGVEDDDDDDSPSTEELVNSVRGSGCRLRAHARARGRSSVSGTQLILERATFIGEEDSNNGDDDDDDNNGQAAANQQTFSAVDTPRTTNQRGLAVWNIRLPENQCNTYRVRTQSRARGVSSNEIVLGLNEGNDDDDNNDSFTVCSFDDNNGGDDDDEISDEIDDVEDEIDSEFDDDDDDENDDNNNGNGVTPLQR